MAIERGAFWDLPHLRRLSLRSSQQLAAINSQAFVGTPNLQTIDAEDCPGLDGPTRQMLDNVTMAATSRQLRLEQQARAKQQVAGSGASPSNGSATPPAAGESADAALATVRRLGPTGRLPAVGHLLDVQNQMTPEGRPQETRLRYLYSLASVAMLLVALKLVLRFSPSTTSYLKAQRRRRRRVYEASKSAAVSEADEFESISSSSGVCRAARAEGGELADDDDDDDRSGRSFTLCERPQIHVIGGLEAGSGAQFGEGLAASPNEDQEADGGGVQPALEADGFIELALNGQDEAVDSSLSPASGHFEAEAQSKPEAVIEPAAEPSLASAAGHYCPECPGAPTCCLAAQQQQPEVGPAAGSGAERSSGPGRAPSQLDLIHSQLVAAGYDYGHANCAHFYQSLGPALQLADLTANFVNQMDYY